MLHIIWDHTIHQNSRGIRVRLSEDATGGQQPILVQQVQKKKNPVRFKDRILANLLSSHWSETCCKSSMKDSTLLCFIESLLGAALRYISSLYWITCVSFFVTVTLFSPFHCIQPFLKSLRNQRYTDLKVPQVTLSTFKNLLPLQK